MNEDRPSQVPRVTYHYDNSNRLTPATDCIGYGPIPEAPPDMALRQSPLFSFAHDTQKGVFRLTWPDGKVEVFRDKPVRHLAVEPDPETGEMRPVVKGGNPTYWYLCREEREVS